MRERLSDVCQETNARQTPLYSQNMDGLLAVHQKTNARRKKNEAVRFRHVEMKTLEDKN